MSNRARHDTTPQHNTTQHNSAMLLPNVYELGRFAGKAIGSVLSRQTLPHLPSVEEITETLVASPGRYKAWWLDLVTKDPIHVLIETTLILSLVYIVLSNRSKDWKLTKNKRGGELTKAEEEELLREWKETGRKPLAPLDGTASLPSTTSRSRPDVIIHKMTGRTLEVTIDNSRNNSTSTTTKNDKNKSKNNGKTKTVLNFATNDFLGMAGNAPVKEASKNALSKYGCGSCGPRGFYGTIDTHLGFEDAITRFMGTDGAIMYSDGASAVASTVAAFAKRGDLLVVDDGIYEPLVAGITLSRANVQWFRHNDMVSVIQSVDCELLVVAMPVQSLSLFPLVFLTYLSLFSSMG